MAVSNDVLPVVTPADNVPGPSQGKWNYKDYLTIPDDGQRYEIINGVLYMPPSPNVAHQSSNGQFTTYLTIHVQHTGLGRVLPAPCDVKLAPNIVVQPDVVVVLNTNSGIIKAEGVEGAPDLVVEIASPSTAGYDRREKQDAYMQSGVKEYWIADPGNKTVEVLVLENGIYRSLGVFRSKATLPSQIIPNLPVRVEQFFV